MHPSRASQHFNESLGRKGMGAAMLLSLAALALWGCQAGPQGAAGPAPAGEQGLTVTGRVVYVDGRAAEDALVTAYTADETYEMVLPTFRSLGRATAAADGSFSLRLPTKTEWAELVALKRGWGVGWTGWSTRRPQGRLTIELAPAASVSGQVLSEDGKPVPGATVMAQVSRGRRRDWLLGEHLDALKTTTGADGRFTLTGLPSAARVRLEVRASGYGTVGGWRYGEDGEVVAPAEGVELKLPPAAPVEVAAVEKGTGRAVEDVTPVAIVFGKTSWKVGQPVAGKKGQFRWSDLPPGRGRVMLTPRRGVPDKWTGPSGAFESSAGRTARVRLELVKGQLAEILITNAETGKPVPEAFVHASSREQRLSAQGNSGEDGIAKLCVVPGTYQIDFAGAARYVNSRPDLKLEVEEGKTARFTVALAPAPSVSGVVRGPDGAPKAGVEVCILGDWGYSLSEKDGSFKIYRDWEERRSDTLVVLARQEQEGLAALGRVTDLKQPLELRLSAGRTVRAEVRDDKGAPLPRARLTVTLGRSDPDPPSGRFEAVTGPDGQGQLAALPNALPLSLRAQAEGFVAQERLVDSASPAGQTPASFQLKPVLRDVAAKVEQIDLPEIPGGWAIWGASGADRNGHIYFGVTAHDVEVPSAHLFEYDPQSGKITDRGDVVGQLRAAGALREGEQQMKIHTRICQLGEYLYFASMDEKGEDEIKGVLPTWGGHLWRMSLKDGRWEHLKAVPEALIAVAVGGGKVYALGYWDHVLYQYDPASGEVRSVKVGSVVGHVSRNFIADSRGHVYVPRVSEGELGTQAALVEFDPDLKELASTPLPFYFEGPPRHSHGIIALAELPDGSIVFGTHNGWLTRIRPSGQGPAEVEQLGWFHPDGPRYSSSLFPHGGRYLMGEVHGGFERAYEWVVLDLDSGRRHVGPFEVTKPAGLSLGRASLYGSMARDPAGACYVVGVNTPPGSEGISRPIALKVIPGPLPK